MQLLEDNQITSENYIKALENEINISANTARTIRYLLSKLSKKHNGKLFNQMTREDLLEYLNGLREPEPIDPLHSWIGTYNLYVIHIVKFFKWLNYPDVAPKERPRPQNVINLFTLRRKEKSIYKPSDLWSIEDDLLFLKYCPSKRDRCYHAISRDTSCRPGEILKLKIKGVVFKMAGNTQYAEVLVNGKTGSRHIPLINCIPYLKDWLDDHPMRTNPNAALICGFGKSHGREISVHNLGIIYRSYKKEFFPKLIDSPNVPPEDKIKIKELLKKPWNPYIRRHTGLTDKSKFLKDSVLKQHAGWSKTSDMPNVYIHYFGNESNESILEAYGLKPKASEEIDKLKPKQCPNCSELNKIDSKFCAKCRMVLSYDAYSETIEQKEKQTDELTKMRDRQERFELVIQSLIDSGQLKPSK